MSGTANNGYGTYGNPNAPNSPWGPGSGWGNNPGWDYWRAWHAAKPLWIAAMVLGFIFWWPVGLALLFFGLWSKRMGYWGCSRHGGWQHGNWQGPPPWAGWKGFWTCGAERDRRPSSSGNRAFDEYRAETLRRLEDEQKEFSDFLDRLRFAKDKSEFDQFMTERRNRPPASPEPPPATAQG
jgi:Protein of unknown function (DUF2852)